MRAFISDSTEMDMGNRTPIKKQPVYGNPKRSDNPNLNRRYKKQKRAILKRELQKEMTY
jgi:hypothetical protein